MAWPQTDANTGSPYNLPYPGTQSLAEVPQDLKDLADAVATALNTKLSKVQTDGYYQPKIVVRTTVPDASVSGVEGAIIVVVAP